MNTSLSRLAAAAAAACVACILLLSACASLLGPRQVEVPLYQLQESLNSRFPFNNRYLELLDISVRNPQLTLQPGTNRLLTTVDASVAPPFLGRSYNGKLSLSGALRFDPARNAIMLADPRVENLAFDGADAGLMRTIAKVGGLVAEQMLRDTPLYTFRQDQLRLGGTNFIPTQIITKANALVVTFEPSR